MTAALLDVHANSSLLPVIDQWWCPICSVQTEDVPLCEMCQQMFLLLVEDLPYNDESKSIVFRYQYGPNAKTNNVQCEAHNASKPISDDNEITLINSDTSASDTYTSLTLQISNVAPSSDDDRKLPLTIFSSPAPSDIEQGALGNCWFVAALALISERSRLLEHIQLTKTVNNEGVYLVRICHNGLWKTIIVDDYLPCTKHNHIVFAQAKRRQLYVPLIEKACAKLFGSYAALRSGNMDEGLQLLTGAPCDYIDLKPSDTTLDGDSIWTKLLSACESKSLIGTSSGGTGVSSEEYARVRIHNNHAFSVLAAHALSNGLSRFVLLRKPHSYSNYREESVTESVLRQLRSVNPAHRSTGAFLDIMA
ncbi:unnamed protein product [Rotaria sp. Silwood2]|nr:unnamed protein product [Rotaria sp. Silwood2]